MHKQLGDHRTFGADLSVSALALVALPCHGRAPLEFVGQRLSSHWRRLLDGQTIRINLWRCDDGRLVVEHPIWLDHRLACTADVVSGPEEAMALLEECCRNPRLSDLTVGTILDNILQVFRTTQFQQGFAALVGDVLADWATLWREPMAQKLKNGAVA